MVGRARELKDALIAVGFPMQNIREFYNGRATSHNLTAALRDFLRGGGRIKDADRLFFYFGGHGAGDSGSGYLVTHDFDLKEPLLTSFLMSDIVGSHFRYVAAHHFLVALDSFSAGLAVPGTQNLGGLSNAGELVEFHKLAVIRADTEPEARNLIVAGTGDQKALSETEGVFTKALINGLRGGADFNRDGLIQYDEMIIYLRDKVIPAAAMKGIRQEPKGFLADIYGSGKVLFVLPANN